MNLLFLALFFVASVIQLISAWQGKLKLKAGSKGFIVASLIGYYFVMAEPLSKAFTLALVFCLIGDMLLIQSRWLIHGGFAFFFAHCFFILSYYRQIQFVEMTPAFIIILALCYAMVVYVLIWSLRGHLIGKMRLAALGYLFGISLMSYFALLQLLSLGTVGATVLYLGTLVFIASDYILLIRTFHAASKLPRKPFLVMLTYISALMLIVWGMLHLH